MSGTWQSVLRNICIERGLDEPKYDDVYRNSLFRCLLEVAEKIFTGLSALTSNRAREEAASKAYKFIEETSLKSH
ncbi:hypothetical protein OnM2_068016 [Erysiphe neolycopersici]|uniref:DRBM domain-containing protein n=1 Tax=Erysiphe neolycopersici TaxID=212602 RepID=A0A420HLG2_9PEZI|nr:hypothetical protein OnM2_068016 [Erysiphe neolycopersici]